jgi:hypothetical protein
VSRLYTTDLKAINHFLADVQIYQKPAAAVYEIKRALGEGVLLVEGEEHKKQVHIGFGFFLWHGADVQGYTKRKLLVRFFCSCF